MADDRWMIEMLLRDVARDLLGDRDQQRARRIGPGGAPGEARDVDEMVAITGEATS
jgi:hypothetical protein